MKKQVDLYCDGACSGNPGPGGWGTILVYKEKELELSGFERDTTNNRMELVAVIKGLETLKERCYVDVYSDSKYVTDSVRKGWLFDWERRGWKNSQKVEPPNRDLWERLLVMLARHEVDFHWVKGHAGHPYNERCDSLAVAQYNENR
ncbi:MAG: ribonuclease HI [Oscillospiraceae bacterium]